MVHEQILRAVVRRDEAEALLVVEPLHFSSRHVLFCFLFDCDYDTGKSAPNDYPAMPAMILQPGRAIFRTCAATNSSPRPAARLNSTLQRANTSSGFQCAI